MVIKFKFSPSGFQVKKLVDGKEVVEKHIYSINRENQCVVCGAKQNFLKFHVANLIEIMLLARPHDLQKSISRAL
jgi:hypothetical protein